MSDTSPNIPSTPEEQWLTVVNEDGTETHYLVDNTFEITYGDETNDYLVLIKQEDLSGTGLVTPDIFRFDPLLEELTPLWDEDEKAFVVDYLMKQYEQPEKPMILGEDE